MEVERGRWIAEEVQRIGEELKQVKAHQILQDAQIKDGEKHDDRNDAISGFLRWLSPIIVAGIGVAAAVIKAAEMGKQP